MVEERKVTISLSSFISVFLVLGIISYFVGVFDGLFTCFGWFVWSVDWESSMVFVVSQWFFTVYPRFSLVVLHGFFIPSFSLSPMTIGILVLIGFSLVFARFTRLLEGFLSTFSAFFLGLIQFLIIAAITGFEPLGTGLMVFPANLIDIYPPFSLVLFQKNIFPLIIFEVFIGVSMIFFILQLFLRDTSQLKRIEAPDLKHFRILKATHRMYIIGEITIAIIIITAIFYILQIQIELPNYYYFINFLNVNNNLFINNLIISECLFYLMLIPLGLIESRKYRLLAKSYTPLIEKELKRKPIILIEDIMMSLGVEEAGYGCIKNLLKSVRSLAEKKNNPIGTYKYRFFYAIKPLVLRATRDIEEKGWVNFNAIALELSVPQKTVVKSYGYLIRKGVIKGVKLKKDYMLKTQNTKKNYEE